MWYLQEVGWGWLIAHWLFMFVFWGGLGLLGMRILSNYRLQTSINSSQRTALDVLRERYAEGEITSDQYKSMKEDMEE